MANQSGIYLSEKEKETEMKAIQVESTEHMGELIREGKLKAIPKNCFPIDERDSLYSSLKETKGYHGIDKCYSCEKDTAEERMLDLFFCTNCGFAWRSQMYLGELYPSEDSV